MCGAALANAAVTLVGVRFRLHGRDAGAGLDCLGVLVAALRLIGREPMIPADYALRVRGIPGELEQPEAYGFACAKGPEQRGDVVLFQVGPCQLHFAVAMGQGRYVHAHAGLKQVVETVAFPDWQRFGQWRLEEEVH